MFCVQSGKKQRFTQKYTRTDFFTPSFGAIGTEISTASKHRGLIERCTNNREPKVESLLFLLALLGSQLAKSIDIVLAVRGIIGFEVSCGAILIQGGLELAQFFEGVA